MRESLSGELGQKVGESNSIKTKKVTVTDAPPWF